MTVNEITLRRLSQLIRQLDEVFRAKDKYEENPNTTWAEVRELYHEYRAEYLNVDLLELGEEIALMPQQE